MIPGLALVEDQISFYNVRRSGVDYNAATLLLAIADLVGIECVAYLPKGMEDAITIWTIDQSVTFPENISVLIPCGVILQVNAGITITFNGPCFNQCPTWYTGPGQIILNSKSAINSQSYADFFNSFVLSGGIHGLSPTCYSPNFATEAYVANGQYIREDSYSIRYGDLGANCASDDVWVIISNFDTPTIVGTNFINVPGTHYYIDYVSTTKPALPADSAWLMEVILSADQIVRVNDMRAFDAAQALLRRISPVEWTIGLTPGDYVFTQNIGTYIQFGRLVYITGVITVADINVAGSGALLIGNLPFEDFIFSAGGFSFHAVRGLRPSYGPGSYSGLIYPNSRLMNIVETISGYGIVIVDASRVLPGFEVYFTGTYQTNLE